MVALHAKYEPKRFSEVVGQDKVMRRLQCLRDTVGLTGQVVALIGESGTGKTTIARLIAHKVTDHICVYEHDAIDVSLDVIRKWERDAQRPPLFGSGYVFIINEAHNLSTQAISRLLTVLDDENVQRFTTWIFTMTTQGQERLFGSKFDALPFMSRAVTLELAFDEDMMAAIARRVMEIAQKENVDGRPFADYLALVKKNGGNMRACLQYVASGGMLE